DRAAGYGILRAGQPRFRPTPPEHFICPSFSQACQRFLSCCRPGVTIRDRRFLSTARYSRGCALKGYPPPQNDATICKILEERAVRCQAMTRDRKARRRSIMRDRFLNSVATVAITAAAIGAAVAVLGTQTSAQGPTTLKTAWGEPDLQGIWTVEYDTDRKSVV